MLAIILLELRYVNVITNNGSDKIIYGQYHIVIYSKWYRKVFYTYKTYSKKYGEYVRDLFNIFGLTTLYNNVHKIINITKHFYPILNINFSEWIAEIIDNVYIYILKYYIILFLISFYLNIFHFFQYNTCIVCEYFPHIYLPYNNVICAHT